MALALPKLLPGGKDLQHAAHAVGEKVHLVYFGLVFVEGHGLYAIAAGVCLGVGLVWEVAGLAAVFKVVKARKAAAVEVA